MAGSHLLNAGGGKPIGIMPAYAPGTVIVIVEDDSAVRDSLLFALRAEGLTCVEFASAAPLLEGADLPLHACLLVDYGLPDLDGLALIAALRRRGMMQPAILLVTNPPVSVRTQAMASGIPLVEKPLVIEQLLATIAGAVARDPST
jgi:two-component system response regulator FixJ